MEKIGRKIFILFLAFACIQSVIFPVSFFAIEATDGPVVIEAGITNSNSYDSTITYDSATQQITYRVTISSALQGDIVEIELPVGVDLVSAPGLTNNNGVIEYKNFEAGSEKIYFVGDMGSESNWTQDASISGVSSFSGVIEYELNEGTGYSFLIVTQANSSFVPYSYESVTSYVGQATATLTSVSTINSDYVSVYVQSQDSQLAFKTFSLTEYLSSSSSAFSSKITTSYISEDGIETIGAKVETSMNPALSGGSGSYTVNTFSFYVECPLGTELTWRTSGVIDITKVKEKETTVIYQVSSLRTFTTSANSLTFTDLLVFDFSTVLEDQTAGDVIELTAYNLSYTLQSFNYTSQEFETVVISVPSENDSTLTSKVYVSPSVNNSLYTTGYTVSKTQWNALNPYTGEAQVLYAAKRTIGTTQLTFNDGTIGTRGTGTTNTILMEYVAIADETYGYLDNVSSVVMEIPFLGADGMEWYTSQIKSITVWYESDDLGSKGITTELGNSIDIDDLITSMLSGGLSTSYSVTKTVDTDGYIVYNYGSSITPNLTFTAPVGESIVKIEVEIEGDNNFYINTNTSTLSTVYGLPKNDSYTGLYSTYQFNTYELEDSSWVNVASSSIGGFSWLEPSPFLLTATDVSLTNANYYYNIATYNTTYDRNYYNGHATEGYQLLGAISISNTSGTPLYDGMYLVSTFEADENSYDVIKEVVFPLCPNEGEDSILYVYYEYENGASYYYSSDSGAEKPYVIEDGQSIIYASGDNSIVKVEVGLSSWGALTTASTFEIYGYIEYTEESDRLDREDEHYMGYQVYDENGDKVEALHGEGTVNSTFTHCTTTGADVSVEGVEYTDVGGTIYSTTNLEAGLSTEVTFEIFGGGLNNVSNGYWNEITFNIVLPDGITLEDVYGVDFSYEKAGVSISIPTDETVGTISVTSTEMSKEDAQKYFDDDSIEGATIYTCTIDDPDVLLYGIRDGYENSTFAKITIVATLTPEFDTPSILLPWSKVLLLGSNYKYSTFKKLDVANLYIQPGTGEITDNLEGALKVGETSTILTGSSNEYLYVQSTPSVLVYNTTLTVDGEEDSYSYTSSSEDSVAILHSGDSGTISYTVTNTINDDDAKDIAQYIILMLPTSTSTDSALVTQADFTTTIDKITVDGTVVYDVEASDVQSRSFLTSTNTAITTRYVNLSADQSLTYSGLLGLYSSASSGYTGQNAIIIEAKGVSSFDVEIDFTMPTTESDGIEYVEFQGMASYYFEESSQTVFYSAADANSSIRFGYENPSWDVSIEAVVVNSAGNITGTLSTGMDSLSVLHNGDVYNDDDSKDYSITPESITGYTFVGWYLDEYLTVPIFDESDEDTVARSITSSQSDYFTVTSDMTLYASYEVSKVQVTYDFNNDSDNYVKTVDWGTAVSNPTAPTKSGYTFTGWYIDEACMTLLTQTTYGEIAGSETEITIYAGYTLNPTHIVTYNVDGNITKIVDERHYEQGEAITVSSIEPTKDGYVFEGWLYNGKIYQTNALLSMGHSDITFIAEWSLQSYTISFYDDDGITKIEDDYTIKYTESMTLPLPQKDGYTFEYWFTLKDTGTKYEAGETYVMDLTNDTFMIAKWTANEYTLSIEGVEEGELEDYTYNDGYAVGVKCDDIIVLPEPEERTGYTFLYWCDSEDETKTYEAGENFTMPAGNCTLEAVWKPNQYQVTFDIGQEEDIVGMYDYGTSITLKKPADVDGYEFLYWIDQDNKEYDAGDLYTVPAYASTLTAIGHFKKYYVYFQEEDDSKVYHNLDINYKDTITMPLPEKEGYTFDYWTYKGGDDTPYYANETFALTTYLDDEASIIFIAHWTINKYELSYDIEDEEKYPTIKEVEYNSTKTLSSYVPTKTGYEFKGWSDGTTIYQPGDSYTMPADNIELTAVWSKNSYTLTFAESEIASSTLLFEESITLPLPIKEGYNFLGWKLDEETTYSANTTFTMSAADVTLTAQWKIHTFDVIFDNDYSSIETTTYQYGDDVVFEELDRTGYKFIGWINEGKIYTHESTYTLHDAGATFVAVWEINEYELSFDDTGDQQIDVVLLDYMQEYVLPTPTKKGYTFVEWKVGSSAYDAGDIFTMETSNVELVGEWKINQYAVTFYNGFSDDVETEVYDYQSLIEFSDLTREGYTFEGWSYNGQLYVEGDEFILSDQAVLFTAVWKANEYTITFNETGNDAIESVQATYNQTYELPVPENTGYTFLYWSDGINNYTEITMPANNVDLVAVWKLDYYTLSFDQTGDSQIEDVVLTYSETCLLDTVYQDGYLFIGWQDENGNMYDELEYFQMPNYDVILTAVWTPILDTSEGVDTSDISQTSYFVALLYLSFGGFIISKKRRKIS